MYQFMKESVLGENFINGNFMIGFHFLYLMKDITLHCKLLPIHMLFSVLFEILNPTYPCVFLGLQNVKDCSFYNYSIRQVLLHGKKKKNMLLTIKLFSYNTITHFQHFLQPIKYPP